MYLSRDEERLYGGEAGETLRRMMEILVALGDIYGAERLVPVRSVQIAGVSFRNIGEAGLEWISDLQGKVVVPSILNPAGMDLCRWREMGIEEQFSSKQLEVVEAYRRLGVTLECTCTPYELYDNIAASGDHLAWSESSAVSYANSVIGARTNREGGPSALASALVGKTPLYGYHLECNRVPTHRVRVTTGLVGADYGALGFAAGRIVGGAVPLFELQGRPTTDDLKSLGAAMAASGSVALYYVVGATPPPPAGACGPVETISIGRQEIQEVYDSFRPTDVDAIALGCPHASTAELGLIADLLDAEKREGRRVTKVLWVFTSRKNADIHPDLVARIEGAGARVICDTCMVVSPAGARFGTIMVNSGKALAYIPGLLGVRAAFGRTEDCIRAATEA